MNYRAVSLILAVLLILCVPAVLSFSLRFLNPQQRNLAKVEQWFAYRFEALAEIRRTDDCFTLDYYTGSGGCARATFVNDSMDEKSARALGKLLAVPRDCPLLVVWPDHSQKLY